MIRALLLALATTLLPPQTPARDTATQTQTGTASISGVVIAAADKQPIGFARVALNDSARITYTNARGEFLFPKLPAGRYAISVQASGYLSMSLGQLQSSRPGIAQVLAANEERKGVVLVMHKGGIVSGHVVGADNRPLADVSVGVLRKSWAQDGSATFIWSGQSKTDDRGDYRISGLIRGYYLVEVVPPTILGRENAATIDEAQRLAAEGMIQTFYPGTTDPASAAPVSVDIDAERPGIDFAIQPAPMWTVSGRVSGAVSIPMATGARVGGERPLSGGTARLVPPGQATGGMLASNFGRGPFARVSPDGHFRFEAVSAGRYELLYQSGGAPSTMRYAFGSASVTVADRDLENVAVDALPAVSVFGEILSGDAPGRPTDAPAFGLIPLSGSWRENNSFLAAATGRRSDPDGQNAPPSFFINNLPPGGYAFRPAPSALGAYLSKIEIDGVPATGTLIEIGTSDPKKVRVTYRTDVAEVSGSVRHEDQTPVTEYALVIFPADKREWPIWMTGTGVSRADSSGHYSYSTRPGSYLIAAVADVEQNQWLDPAFLESLIPTATKITLGSGQKLSQDFIVK